MLETSQCLRTRSKLIELKKLNNNLIVACTNLHGAKLFSTQDCQIQETITHEQLNSLSLAVSFSQNAEFVAFGSKSHIYILHIPSKILIKTIKIDSEIIEMLEFDNESKYIIAATKSGRVLQYRYDGSSLLARLYSFKVTNSKKNTNSLVSSFTFYKNIMACGGNNGIIFSINLHTRTGKQTLHNDNYRINSLCILNSTTIVSGDNKGNLYVNSLTNNKLIKKIETGFTKIIQIILMPNPNYIMIIGEEKYIAIYDIHHFKLLHSKYLEFDDIVTKVLVSDKNSLLVALNNNTIEQVNLPDASELADLIKENLLDKAFILCEQHLMLKGTQEYKELEKAYTKIYNQALEALINHNNDRAHEFIKIFKYTESKKEELQLLFKAFENYPRFKNLYLEKKFALAYTMSSVFPPLKKTFQYAKMEELWKESFKNAQRQIAHGKPENAKTLLNEYITIESKRPIIKLILNNNDIFIEFLKAIESKEFKKVDTIAKTNELFTKIPTYKNVQKEMSLSIIDIQKDIDNCDLNSAIKKVSKLHNIDSVISSVSVLKNECKALKKLQDAYKENQFIKCYEIIDNNPSLNSTQLAILLQDHWFKIISKCEGFALKGNIKDIKTTLGDLIQLSTRRDKIGDLFRLSFHTKIKSLIAKKTYKKAEAIVYSYIDIFGLDNEISSIMKIYESISKTKLAITQNARQPRDNWINSQTIMGS